MLNKTNLIIPIIFFTVSFIVTIIMFLHNNPNKKVSIIVTFLFALEIIFNIAINYIKI